MYFYFYIISCKDCDYCYIGHAVNLRVRMNLHRWSVDNRPNQKLYKTIKENGGWDNWYYDILDEGEYNSERDALVKECEIYDLLLPSGWLLNINRPIRLPKDDPRIHQAYAEAVARHREKNKKPPRQLLTPEEYAERQKEAKRKWYERSKLKPI